MSQQNGNVRFVRINGRVVPLRGKGSAPAGMGISKRYGAKRDYPKPTNFGYTKAALIGGAAGAGYAIATKSRFLTSVAIGALLGLPNGAVQVYRKGKGESDRQLAARIAFDGLNHNEQRQILRHERKMRLKRMKAKNKTGS